MHILGSQLNGSVSFPATTGGFLQKSVQSQKSPIGDEQTKYEKMESEYWTFVKIWAG